MSNKPSLRDLRLNIMVGVIAWEGEIGNSRVRDLFGLQPVQASRLLSEFRLMMGDRIVEDGRAKLLKPASAAEIGTDITLDEYLRLSQQGGRGEGCFVDARVDLTEIRPAAFAALRKAALTKTGVVISYASMNNPCFTDRLIFPHSIVHVGRRWHTRAWCVRRKEFRDFTLGRICAAVPSKEKAVNTNNEDFLWNRIVEVCLATHRDLPSDQKQVVQNEYFYGEISRCMSVRACLAPYVIQDLRAATNPEREGPPEFQMEVANIESLKNLMFSNSDSSN